MADVMLEPTVMTESMVLVFISTETTEPTLATGLKEVRMKKESSFFQMEQ